jgi:hypothetical protein
VRKTVGISREKPVHWVKHGIQIWEVASVSFDEKAIFKQSLIRKAITASNTVYKKNSFSSREEFVCVVKRKIYISEQVQDFMVYVKCIAEVHN